MKRNVLAGCAAAVLAVLALGATAYADQRSYVWTYEYLTLAKGGTELEFYKTAKIKDLQVGDGSDWEQQIELEYGITDHLDAALYEVYEQKNDDKMKYAGYKFRLRYRIAERNVLPVDVLLYAEHQEKVDARNVFEGKVILAKDIGNLNIAYNQIYKDEYVGGSIGKHEYAAALSYEFLPWLRIGVESKGSWRDGKFAAGPTVSWSGGRIWANVGAVYALNEKTNDRETRFLLGIPF